MRYRIEYLAAGSRAPRVVYITAESEALALAKLSEVGVSSKSVLSIEEV